MMAAQFQIVAETVAARGLNGILAGVVLASCTWVLVRCFAGRSASTKFAVWFTALLSTAGLPFLWPARTIIANSRPRLPQLVFADHWAALLVSAWAAVAGILVLRLCVSMWRVQSLRQTCRPAEDLPLWHELISDFSDRKFSRLRQVQLLISDNVRIPAALGFLRPAVALPAWACEELAPNELRAVLLHELAHLQRRDDWTNLAQKFIKAFLFFHPAVWWIDRRLSLERELACDDLVLAHNAGANTYAASLLSIAERVAAEKTYRRGAPSLAQSALGRACGMSLRLAQILDKNRSAARTSWRTAAALAGGLAVLTATAMPFAPELVSFQQRAQQLARVPDVTLQPNRLSAPRLATVNATLTFQAESSSAGSKTSVAQNSDASALSPRMYPRRAVIPAEARTQKALTPARTIMAGAQTSGRPTATLLVLRSAQVDEFGMPVWSFSVWRITASNSGRQETVQELFEVSSI